MKSQDRASLPAPDDYRATVSVVVAVRWLLLLTAFFILHYRIERDLIWTINNLMAVGLVAANAYLTWRIATQRAIKWHHALVPSLLELAAITAGLYLFAGFQNAFFLFYYPALLGISLLFPGRVSFAALAAVMASHVVMAFTISPTLDYDLKQEKELVGRLATMVGMVVAGTLINGWERARRREAVAAERRQAEENLELQSKAQRAEMAALEERSRLSREIHDGIAQSIYMLNLQLETCVELAERRRDDLKQRLSSLVELSKETLLEVRHYIFDLKPYLAGEKGIISMVDNQVREFKNVAGVPASLETSGDEFQVPAPVATCLYRVTQEALSNTFKHAAASQVSVSLRFLDDGVKLEVEDDGAGFDASATDGGQGLDNMRRRAEELGGAFRLDSTPGKGTRVAVEVPCPPE